MYRNFMDLYGAGLHVELTSWELARILLSDMVQVESEVNLLDALVKWVLHDRDSRKEDGRALVPRIRFGVLVGEGGVFGQRTSKYTVVGALRTADAFPILYDWFEWRKDEHFNKVVSASQNAQVKSGVSRAEFSANQEQYRPRKPR
jgi:hypothetical protein